VRAEDEAMGDLLQPWHIIVLVALAFVLFGAKRLPELGKGLGEGLKGFKEGLKGINEPAAPAPPVQQQTASSVPPATAPAEPKS
jgi:sec-independent protein translocase protein TatA